VDRATADFCGANVRRKEFVPRPNPIQLLLVTLLLLATSAPALAARQARINAKVSGACVGDTITVNATVQARRGTRFTLRLLRQQTAETAWVTTRKSRRFTSRGGTRTYRFRFDVSDFDAYAYRLGIYRSGQRTLSRPIAGASCAPGLQVPEAPAAFLLPLSLLATSSLLLLRRRRATR
jgi:hypothetical protein